MMRTAFHWLFDSMARTYVALGILVLGVAAASANQITSYDVTNSPPMFLDASINTSQTTSIRLSAPQRNGQSVTFANQTGGILRIKQGTRVEDLSFTGATVNATTKVVTLQGVTRDLCWNQGNSFLGCGNGQAFGKGSIVELNIDARLLNRKANRDRANTFTASGAIRFTGSGSFTPPTFVTTAERDRQLGAIGSTIRMACVTSTGACYLRTGGTWNIISGSGTVNATETLAGKVELGTVAEHYRRAQTGATAANLAVQVKNLTMTGGVTYAGNVPLLNSSGLIDTTLMSASAVEGLVFGFGTDGDRTIGSGVTLTRDMYYRNLTVNTGAFINTGGFRIFVSATATLYGSTGSIIRNANAGSNGSNASGQNGGNGGGSGTVLSDGHYRGGIAGAQGGRGGTTVSNGISGVAVTGNPGRTLNYTVGLNGAAGAAGGTGGVSASLVTNTAGAAGGAAGVAALSAEASGITRNISTASLGRIFTMTGSVAFAANGGAGGGGGATAGSCNQSNAATGGGGGGGGGSGSNGGLVSFSARTLVGTGRIEARGGLGGAGGTGAAATASNCGGGGGGGGGSGGSGGFAALTYVTAANWSGSVSVTGGNGGTGGTFGAGHGTGAAGVAGTAGTTGISGISITFDL